MIRVETLMPQELLDKLNKHCPDGTRAEFIRRAINNELTNSHNAGKEFNSMKRKINSIDLDSLHQALGDLLSTAHVIFSEHLTHFVCCVRF